MDEFNKAASWKATTFKTRWHICKLAGFDRPFDVADVTWTSLHEVQRELISETVRRHINELPASTWGLA